MNEKLRSMRYGVAAVSVLLLSGCWRKKQEQPVVYAEQVLIPQSSAEESSAKLFDGDEKAFVLDADNPFTPAHNVALVEDNALWSEEQGNFETFYFDFDKDAIRPEYAKSIQHTATQLQQIVAEKPNVTIVVEGHACSSAGSLLYNMQISERRARKVRDALVAAGAPSSHLTVVGRGTEALKVPSGDRDQQAPNRRVEIHVVHKSA